MKDKRKLPKDIKSLTRLLDHQFEGPFNLKFGLDNIIGLIPFWGDLISLVLSHYVLVRSIALQCPKSILFKMIINTYIDFVIGCIPLLGDIFDLYWRANTKNSLLLEMYLNSPETARASSRISNGLFLLGLAGILGLCFFILFWLFQQL